MYTVPDLAGGGPSGGPVSSPSAQNQYMSFPSMNAGYPMPTPQGGAPGVVPPTHTTPAPFTPAGTGGVGATDKLPGNEETVPTVDPNYTASFGNWLQSQLGTGVSPFNLSALLPSSGQATAPGTLTAPENSIMQSLQNFYLTGQGGPLPGVLPMWQSEMQSMQIPIEQQLANIKEQFGSMGALGSSEMGTALANFGSQTAADENTMLLQATQAALPGMSSFGSNVQNLDQSSISNLLNEFNYTLPQNNPLNQMLAQFATTYPSAYGKSDLQTAFGQQFGKDAASGLSGLLFG